MVCIVPVDSSMMVSVVIIILMLRFLSITSGNGLESEFQMHDFSSKKFLQKPLAKEMDPTGPSRKLVQFTNDELLQRKVIKVTENVFVAVGWALANSIMIIGKSNQNKYSSRNIL